MFILRFHWARWSNHCLFGGMVSHDKQLHGQALAVQCMQANRLHVKWGHFLKAINSLLITYTMQQPFSLKLHVFKLDPQCWANYLHLGVEPKITILLIPLLSYERELYLHVVLCHMHRGQWRKQCQSSRERTMTAGESTSRNSRTISWQSWPIYSSLPHIMHNNIILSG